MGKEQRKTKVDIGYAQGKKKEEKTKLEPNKLAQSRENTATNL